MTDSLMPMQSRIRPSQLNAMFSQFMQTAQESLVHVITSLESDQLLEQMRNDQNLYNEKMNYINEVIKQHFVLQPINQLLVKEIQSHKENEKQLEAKLEESREEYISELSNIEVQYNQFLREKQNQKRVMENTIQEKNHEIFMLNKDFNIKTKDLQTQCQNLINQIEILKDTEAKHKLNLSEVMRQNEKLSKQITSLKQIQTQYFQQAKTKNNENSLKYTQLQEQNNYLQQQFKQTQHQIYELTQNEQAYLQTIAKMKQDMFLIKQEWEKRCEQVQKQLMEDYREKLMEHEQQMNQKLLNYMDELKMGKNVIIQSSQQILQSKKQLIQERFNAEIKRYQQDIQALEQELREEKSRSKDLSCQVKALTEKLTAKQTQCTQAKQRLETEQKIHESLLNQKHHQYQQKLTSIKTQTSTEIQRLRKTESMLLKDLKASKQEKQQILKEVQSLKEEFASHKEKQQKEGKRLKQLEQINENSNMKILELKKDLAILNEKSTMDEKSLKERNNQIHRLENSLGQLKHQYKELDTVARRLQLKISQLNLKAKEQERTRAEISHKVQKLFLLVRKLSKQLTLVKQDITFHLNMQKSKFQSIILSVTQQVSAREEVLKLSHKQKLRQLLDEIDEEKRQQRVQQEQILRENQNMKKEIRLMEQVMQEKDEDFTYGRERAVSLEVEKCRLIMQEEVNKEREERRKLQQKMYNQEKRYEYTISKAEKQVSKQVGQFMAKWQHKITQSQQLLSAKQKALSQLTNQLKKLTIQHQSLEQQFNQSLQKMTKFQRKYQSLKQQRDKTIDDMMKRLQKQTKHKLALQRQLKDIRGEIMKTQTQTNSSSPFNNYSFTDRQNTNVYTNAFMPGTATIDNKMKTQAKQTVNREKELSQIREMIAKTYKVVETGPEKDLSPAQYNRNKLF